jgi:hypothetical protein
VRLGVNRAEGSIQIRRERISRLDRLRDGAGGESETTAHTGCFGKALRCQTIDISNFFIFYSHTLCQLLNT